MLQSSAVAAWARKVIRCISWFRREWIGEHRRHRTVWAHGSTSSRHDEANPIMKADVRFVVGRPEPQHRSGGRLLAGSDKTGRSTRPALPLLVRYGHDQGRQNRALLSMRDRLD